MEARFGLSPILHHPGEANQDDKDGKWGREISSVGTSHYVRLFASTINMCFCKTFIMVAGLGRWWMSKALASGARFKGAP